MSRNATSKKTVRFPGKLLPCRGTHALEVNVACTLTTISNTGCILRGQDTSPLSLTKGLVWYRYCTVMCNKGAACNRALCFFAHSPEELRTTALSREVSFNNDPLTIADQLSDSCSSARNNFEKARLKQTLLFTLVLCFRLDYLEKSLFLVDHVTQCLKSSRLCNKGMKNGHRR